MLKTRIIPILLCRGRELVKGKGFDSWRRVGNTLQAARVHNAREVDELVILSAGGLLLADMVASLCKDTFMPVSIGGGIRNMNDVEMLFGHGADKIVLNTGAVKTPDLITEAAARYGSQSVVVSVDVLNGKVVINNAREDTDLDPAMWAHQAQSLGAGEILLNSVVRDGTMEGYDLPLIQQVSSSLRIPVVACGGCGSPADMLSVLKYSEAHAVAAGAMFLFRDFTPKSAAIYLKRAGIQVRI